MTRIKGWYGAPFGKLRAGSKGAPLHNSSATLFLFWRIAFEQLDDRLIQIVDVLVTVVGNRVGG
jgi:hypothetical protein